MHYATLEEIFVYNNATLLHNATMLNSIRHKIYAMHLVAIIAILSMVVLVSIDIRFLEEQLPEAGTIKSAIEVHRQLSLSEEMLLVYKSEATLDLLNDYIISLKNLLSEKNSSLTKVLNKNELHGLADNFESYQSKILNTYGTDNYRDAVLKLSKINNQISEYITLIENRHHESLAKTIHTTQNILITGLIIITGFALFSALWEIRFIIIPLHILEKEINQRSPDDTRLLPTNSSDREIQSFTHSFNLAIKRIRNQELNIRRTEKATALGILASGVAHELNNPLSNISTSTQLLLEEGNSCKKNLKKQWLNHIDQEVERARRIIKRLLANAQYDNKTFHPISSNRLVGNAVTLIHRQIDPSIIIDMEDITETELFVQSDRLYQVFINLINNAIDAGAKNIWIFGEVLQGSSSLIEKQEKNESFNNSYFLFTIVDDGSGIEESDIPNLFVPFFTTKKTGEGTGLGLYLVNEIIQEHNGSISVQNRKENPGCEFLILLPLTNDEDS